MRWVSGSLGWLANPVQMKVCILISKYLKNMDQVNELLNEVGSIFLSCHIYVYSDLEGWV